MDSVDRSSVGDLLGRLSGVRRSGSGWIARCPAHDDRSPSLSVDEGAGGTPLVYCHAGCSFRSVMDALGCDVPRSAFRRRTDPLSDSLEPAMAGLEELSRRFQAALPGSPGAVYLLRRKIPLELAMRMGVGYAAPGLWPHLGDGGVPVRQWKRGRVTFPHTTPDGRIVNLYGRAVDTLASHSPRQLRHDHLPGAKAVFNGPAMRRARDYNQSLYICEGVFDSLSLMAAGRDNVVAILGVNFTRISWIEGVARVVIALDNPEVDETSRRKTGELAQRLAKVVPIVERFRYDEMGGAKDLNAALVAGLL